MRARVGRARVKLGEYRMRMRMGWVWMGQRFVSDDLWDVALFGVGCVRRAKGRKGEYGCVCMYVVR